MATDDLESADVVVLNTCCIRENADNKFYGHLGNLKSLRESRPDMQIAVGGCLAQMDREHIQQRAGHVDVVFGTHNLGRAPALLRQAATAGPVMEILDEPLPEADPAAAGSSAAALTAVRDLPYAAWVTIQIGCDNSCAFCIVPSVRGGEVSRPFADLVAEVEVLADRGVSEVTLLGQNVNSYGRDLTKRRPLFADLLRAVGAVEGIRRVRFTSPHPKDLRPETIAAMAETPAVCNHLHLPLQAGSNATLAAMRRGYTAQRYLERLAAARAAIPDLAVTTDLIVGLSRGERGGLRGHPRGGGGGGVRQRLHLHLLAAPGYPGGRHGGSVRPRGRGGRALRAAAGGGGALGAGQAPGPHRPGGGGAGRRALQARPVADHRTDRPEQAGALRTGR